MRHVREWCLDGRSDDRPDLERFTAKRMEAKTIEVKAGRLSLISPPGAITKLILG